MKTLTINALKPRNPLVVPSRRRKAGAHRHPATGRRRAGTRDLRDELKLLHRPEP